jgi:hypothetical protein
VKRTVRQRYEPNNLDLASILPDSEKKHLDRYGYVVSHLYESRFLDNRWKQFKSLGKTLRKKRYIPMNAVVMRRILDKRHYKRILQNLSLWGIIEEDRQYLVGQKSRSYRLTAQYANVDFCTFAYSPKFSARLDVIQKEDRKKQLTAVHKDIAEQIERNFTVDMTVAKKLLKTLQLDKTTAIRTRLALDRMRRGEFGHSVSGKTGRYFNHLVNLKRELRQAIVCRDGRRLLEVDIANSQPFFLAFLLECIERNVKEVLKIAEDVKVDTATLPKLSLHRDLQQFKELTVRGRFYEYLCMQTGLSREVVKEETLKTFFKPMYYTTAFEKTFHRLFPHVFAVLKTLKPKSAHNTLAILLQRMESMVVIETLCDLMVVEDIPYIPLHDGVLVPSQTAPSVAKTLRYVSYYYSRLKPTVRIKTLEGKTVVSRRQK